MPNQNEFAPTDENSISDFQALFVGEGKKYATAEEAFKGLYHANKHIETLTADNETVRQELATRAAVEELLKNNVDNPKLVQPAPVMSQTPPAVTPQAGQAPSEKELSELIRETMTKERQESQKTENLSEATRTLDQVFGSREATNAAVSKRAAELGIGVELLKQAAMQSPASLYVMMGVDTSKRDKASSVAPSGSDVSTMALEKQSSSQRIQEGTYAYYENIRKTDPKRYAQVSSEMFKLSQEDPDKFFGRT